MQIGASYERIFPYTNPLGLESQRCLSGTLVCFVEQESRQGTIWSTREAVTQRIALDKLATARRTSFQKFHISSSSRPSFPRLLL
jgi:hypothetical protein